MTAKIELSTAQYGLAEELAAKGNRLRDIAAALGMHSDTLRLHRQEDHELDAAIERGRGKEHAALVGVLYSAAVDKGNVAAAMFLLKCRHGYRESGPENGEGGARVAVVVNLPGALDPTQYAKLIEVHGPALQADGGGDA